MAIGDNNLQLATGIDPQVMVPGEVFELAMHVHNGAGRTSHGPDSRQKCAWM